MNVFFIPDLIIYMSMKNGGYVLNPEYVFLNDKNS